MVCLQVQKFKVYNVFLISLDRGPGSLKTFAFWDHVRPSHPLDGIMLDLRSEGQGNFQPNLQSFRLNSEGSNESNTWF